MLLAPSRSLSFMPHQPSSGLTAFACDSTPGCCHSAQLLRVLGEMVPLQMEALPPCHGTPCPGMLLSQSSLPGLYQCELLYRVHLKHLCPRLSVAMNTLYTPTVHYDSHWAQGGCWTPEMDSSFNFTKHKLT